MPVHLESGRAHRDKRLDGGGSGHHHRAKKRKTVELHPTKQLDRLSAFVPAGGRTPDAHAGVVIERDRMRSGHPGQINVVYEVTPVVKAPLIKPFETTVGGGRRGGGGTSDEALNRARQDLRSGK